MGAFSPSSPRKLKIESCEKIVAAIACSAVAMLYRRASERFLPSLKTAITCQVTHALVLAREDLAGIAAALRENYPGPFAFEAAYSDGTTRTHADFPDLLSYENPSFRRLTSLKLIAGAAQEDGCNLVIKPRLLNSCRIHIADSDEKRARKLADELSNRLAECRPLYSFATRFSPAWCCAASMLIGLVLLHATGVIDLEVFLIPGLFLIAVTSLYFGYGWKWLFPKVWFLLGRQEKEFAKRATIRNWIFGTILGGVVIGVLGNLVTQLLSL
jgi:hypothetical protein